MPLVRILARMEGEGIALAPQVRSRQQIQPIKRRPSTRTFSELGRLPLTPAILPTPMYHKPPIPQLEKPSSDVFFPLQVLKDQRGPLEARLRQLAAKAHLAAGMTFDLNSPKDVSEVLFQHLNLPPPPCAFSNQNQRHPSTKKEVRA